MSIRSTLGRRGYVMPVLPVGADVDTWAGIRRKRRYGEMHAFTRAEGIVISVI
jgi:hypothetical protein